MCTFGHEFKTWIKLPTWIHLHRIALFLSYIAICYLLVLSFINKEICFKIQDFCLIWTEQHKTGMLCLFDCIQEFLLWIHICTSTMKNQMWMSRFANLDKHSDGSKSNVMVVLNISKYKPQRYSAIKKFLSLFVFDHLQVSSQCTHFHLRILISEVLLRNKIKHT